MVLHPPRSQGEEPDLRAIEALAQRNGIPTVKGATYLTRPGDYIDDIHLGPSGQNALAKAMFAGLEALNSPKN